MTETNNLPAVRKVTVQLAQPLGDLDQAWRAAKVLSQSRLLPAALYANNPEQTQANVTLVLWYGAELGLPPMQAIQNIYVVKGKPQLAGSLWLAKVREAGHQAFVACKDCDRAPEDHPAVSTKEDHRYVKDHDEARCTWTIIRGDTGDRHTETFTIEDAVRAGLCTLRDGKPYSRSAKNEAKPWESWTRRMLLWRTLTNAATTICPEVALGYGMEGDEVAAEAEPADALAQAVDARTEPPKAAEPEDVQDAEIVADPDGQARQEAADEQRRQDVLDIEAEYSETGEPLIDPDCAAGKCGSCSGPPCQHECHTGGGS
jgi:hypothetical protein